MDANTKKTALRMIPYGLYILTAGTKEGEGQESLALTFFKPTGRQGNTISGEPFKEGVTGSPILENTTAFVECRLVESTKAGDHTVFIGEVVEAGLRKPYVGRPDEATLWLKDLGEKMFYGG